MLALQAGQLFYSLYCFVVAGTSSDNNFDLVVVSILKNVNVNLTLSFLSLDNSFPSDKVLKQAEQLNFALKVLASRKPIQFDNMNIIVAETFDGVTNFLLEALKAREYFVIVITKAFKHYEILNFFTTARKLKIANLSVVYKENGIFKTAYLPAFSDICKNRYSEPFLTEAFNPLMPKLFPRPTNHPDDCSIKVTTFNSPPFVIVKNKTITGRDIDLMTAISKALKLKITYDIVDGDSPWVSWFELLFFFTKNKLLGIPVSQQKWFWCFIETFEQRNGHSTWRLFPEA